MKRAFRYMGLGIFFLFLPLLFNVQIKNFQIRSKSQEIDHAVKNANLIGKQRDVVVKSLKDVFKGETVELLDYDEKNLIVFTFEDVANSFEFSDGPASWDIWVVLHFDRKTNRLIKYDLTTSSTHL